MGKKKWRKLVCRGEKWVKKTSEQGRLVPRDDASLLSSHYTYIIIVIIIKYIIQSKKICFWNLVISITAPLIFVRSKPNHVFIQLVFCSISWFVSLIFFFFMFNFKFENICEISKLQWNHLSFIVNWEITYIFPN